MMMIINRIRGKLELKVDHSKVMHNRRLSPVSTLAQYQKKCENSEMYLLTIDTIGLHYWDFIYYFLQIKNSMSWE